MMAYVLCNVLETKHLTRKTLLLITQKAFGNVVGKGENTDNQNFLLFQQWFLLVK